MKLSEEEARPANFTALSVMTGVPAETLRSAANPNGSLTDTLAIRLVAAAKVPVEVLLGGKLVVTTPIIGKAARPVCASGNASASAPPSRAALAVYAGPLHLVVASLRPLIEDATAETSKRVHGCAFLRRELFKGIRELEVPIEAAAPA